LDEIPQLWNILRGDMSLVGPRPERPTFVTQFAEAIPGYDERHVVRPGLTGLAQVRGHYSSEPAAKLRYDLFYIRRCSLLFDLQIVLETAGAMLDRSSAEGVIRPTHIPSLDRLATGPTSEHEIDSSKAS